MYMYIVLLLSPFFIMACTLYTSQYRSNEITTCKHYLARQERSIDLYSLRMN